MAISQRKSNGCRRGTYKPKRMGKGYAASHKPSRGMRPEHSTPEAVQARVEKLRAEAAAKNADK